MVTPLDFPRYNEPQPESGRLPDARHRYGVSRSWLYRQAQKHPGLLIKIGRATLVDFIVLRAIIANLPTAEIRGRH
jgi:hypothetical protein